MTADAPIRVEGLWKRYGLPLGRPGPWALKDLSFSVARGETLGVIGRNGAGKSTLLKLLAGVTPATRGRLEVSGRVFPMIELNAGVHPELTGRENVFLLGAIIGFARRETAARLRDIEEFCELGDWFDRPVRTYSSGMLARLGFGVAMHADADILLVDEVLAVGDLAFQKKCYDHLERLRSRSVTTVFVSHNVRQVQRLCGRALLLEDGEAARLGPVEEVLDLYYERSHEGSLRPAAGGGLRPFEGTGELVVDSVEVLDGDRRPCGKAASGGPVGFRLSFRTRGPVERPVVALGINTLDLIPVMAFSNEALPGRPSFDGSGTYDVLVPEFPLLRGIYSVRVKVLQGNGAVLFGAEDMARFQVVSPAEGESHLSQAGLVRTRAVWDERPSPGPGA